MYYSYNWLKELTKTKLSPEKAADLVNLRGFEVEGTEKLEERYQSFVVGKILEVEKHPNADKLQVVKVDIGETNSKSSLKIVCGAYNIKTGHKVPVALIGAILPNSKIEIKETELRGVKSQGMLCAEDELGLGKDHEGIMVLENKLKTGMPLAKALGLDDTVLELDVLPNRAHDCLSYEGMSREISAMFGQNFSIANYQLLITNKKSKNLSIETKDKELCPRYIGAVLGDVKIGPSPNWMQARLVASGMEPINNVVDITNYVMLEVGSPLHAFDFKQIESGEGGAKIIIRKAKEGEKLELLDETKIKLDKKDLIITNPEKVLALAGIKGGKDSGISNKTNTIVLEAANFNKLNIRKARQRHALLTESQGRFEKGIAPELAERAATRAIELLEKYAGAKLIETTDDNFHQPKKQTEILELSRLDSLLGYKVNKKRAVKILENLGFKLIKQNKKRVTFRVPFWRLDIEGPEDLIEEVGRIEGYEKIEEREAYQAVSVPKQNESRKFEWRIKEFLRGLGLDEVMNYSFYGKEDIENCGLDASDHLELENPLSEELKFLRVSLIPGLLKNVSHNAKYFDSFAIFELGRVYETNAKGRCKERLVLAGAAYNEDGKNNEFYNIKARLEEAFSRMFGLEIFFRSGEKYADKILHPVRSAVIKSELDDKKLGRMGDVAPSVAKKYGIKNQVDVFEIDFELFRKNSNSGKTYQPLRKYPTTLRDISMFVSARTETATIVKAMKKTGGKELIKVDLFDVYLDKKKNQKSLAFHLTFGKDDRTMKNKEVDELMKKVGAELEKAEARVRKK